MDRLFCVFVLLASLSVVFSVDCDGKYDEKWTLCQQRIHDFKCNPVMDVRAPRCQSNGDFYPRECDSTEYGDVTCWCQHVKTGQVIEGTRISWTNPVMKPPFPKSPISEDTLDCDDKMTGINDP